MNLQRLFQRPPSDYAPLAFWFWNGDLKAGALIAQARDMFAHGVRGFFMHGRSGLVRPAYLSRGWMNLIEAVVLEAKRLGAKAWLYDEMGWPSGSAGGRVPRLGPQYQQKFVECIPLRVNGATARVAAGRKVVAVFHSRTHPPSSERDLSDATDRLGPGKVVNTAGMQRGWLLAFAIGYQPAYVDTLSRQPVAAFVRFTHEAYEQRIGRHFGKTVPGIFTDEPSHRAYDLRDHVLKAPWTDRLPFTFEVRCGYSPLAQLPSLFFDAGDFKRVRHDFWGVVSELLATNYGGTIFDWCEQNGLAFTGHYEYEVPLHMQIQCLSAAMPLYRRMQIPGLDLLGRNRPRYERRESIVLAKQPASIANQCGRRRVLCEAFGTGGWDLGPERQKWQADWLFALGVNMLCLHGLYYSIAGGRRFDAPPDFLRQPWWEISKALHDHYARVSFMLSQGRPRRDVVVIHPVRAAWARHRPQDHIGICDREDSPMGMAFGALLEALVENHLDFDLADEGFLGQGDVRKGLLALGQAEYRVAIIPPRMDALEPSTASLLNEMAEQGGTVISLSNPKRVHRGRARSSVLGAAVKFVTRPPGDSAVEKAVALAGDAIGERTRLTGIGAEALAAHERELPGAGRAIFLSNSSLEEVRAELSVPGSWRVEEWNTASGEARPVRCSQVNGATNARLQFAPAGSHLLLLKRGKAGQRYSVPAARERVVATLSAWRVKARAPNLLTFDHCRAGAGVSRRWGGALPIFKVRQRRNPGGIRFEFVNNLSQDPRPPLLFAYERAEAFRIEVNGERVKRKKAALPRYLDFCSAVDITQALAPGKNAVDLLPLSSDSPVEEVYLLGDFGVRQVGPALFAVEEPRLKVGPWHECGFPFFGGPMEYSCHFTMPQVGDGRILLEVESLGEATSVFVNGRKAGDMLWRPWRMEITRLLRPGDNVVRLLVYGTLRNAFGPWHFPGDAGCAGFSYKHWTDAFGWTDEYLFVPLGMLGPARLSLLPKT